MNRGKQELSASQSQPSGAHSGAATEAGGSEKKLNEPVLPDDYPIYADYFYVADGKVVRSAWHGITARQFKGHLGAAELRRCDIAGRQARFNAKATGADQ